MQFSISIIIPVLNGERFVEKAILSALNQTEVTEVIVVDDGSTDTTLSIVSQLQKKESRIKIYQHPNGINKGRSATRNLGLKNAAGNYIAFLDADDYYLENRFSNDMKMFDQNLDCDGVYNAVAVYYYRTPTAAEEKENVLNTISRKIKSEKLFKFLLSGKYGHFHIDGLTIKRNVFEEIGFFNEDLVVAEDTDLLWKMALKCRLETGIINKPLAMRGVHDSNVFNRVDLYKIYILKMYESLIIWSSNNNVSHEKIDDLLKWLWLTKYKENNKLYQDTLYWAFLFLPNFRLLFSILSIKYFPLVRLRKKLFPFLYH